MHAARSLLVTSQVPSILAVGAEVLRRTDAGGTERYRVQYQVHINASEAPRFRWEQSPISDFTPIYKEGVLAVIDGDSLHVCSPCDGVLYGVVANPVEMFPPPGETSSRKIVGYILVKV